MSQSRKYSRTYHYPFSPGTTNDDRINRDYWEQITQIDELVHTEKLDGENTCLNQYGVFARSHMAPTRHPWVAFLRERWQLIRDDLGELEIFGENLYAVHSIEYEELEAHFFVFAIREGKRWLSWEEVTFYAALLDFPTVPVLEGPAAECRETFEAEILKRVESPSTFGSRDAHTGEPYTMEGIVTRNAAGFATDAFRANVFKYVRANHVQTDEHWTRRWRRARLKWE